MECRSEPIRNSSTILINSRRDVEIKRLIFAPLCYLLGRRHGPEFHGDANESPENREEKERGGRGAYLRQREWAGIMVGEAPCTRAFLLLAGACLISSRATGVSVQRALH